MRYSEGIVVHRVLLVLLCACLTACASHEPDPVGYSVEQVKAALTPLTFSRPFVPPDAVADYFRFYDLNPAQVKHYFGTVESEGHLLAMQVFMPDEPRGTLFLLHGYFDHTGTLSRLIKEGLARDYAVVSWDLPGHGLSTGDRTDTGEFDLCAKQFIDVIKRAEPLMPHPFNLVAHSTGCSIALEYMYVDPTNAFEEIIFLAPLIKHTRWRWAKFGYAVANPFKKTVKRRKMYNTSDEEFLAFVQRDPLQSKVLSFEYLGDLYEWEKRSRDYPVWPGSLCIIQGDTDAIVDWEYNLPFLSSKIQRTEIHMIPGARHQLVNEREELRNQVFELIFNTLDAP
jgi:alpha-beta hydrolase superfamily lysophospholipase